MAHLESVEAYLEGKGPAGVALFRAFQELVERCGPAEVAPSCSIVYGKRKRIFAGAWVERTRFELNGDLVRDAEHPCKLAAFPLTKRVITHRLRVTAAAQLDDALSALGAEAYEQVGPGTRGLASRRP